MFLEVTLMCGLAPKGQLDHSFGKTLYINFSSHHYAVCKLGIHWLVFSGLVKLNPSSICISHITRGNAQVTLWRGHYELTGE